MAEGRNQNHLHHLHDYATDLNEGRNCAKYGYNLKEENLYWRTLTFIFHTHFMIYYMQQVERYGILLLEPNFSSQNKQHLLRSKVIKLNPRINKQWPA